MPGFNGLGMSLGTLSRLSDAKSRSISPENFDGAKGKGGMATEGTGAEYAKAGGLGQGWKISPSIFIEPGDTFTLAERGLTLAHNPIYSSGYLYVVTTDGTVYEIAGR